MRKRQHELRDIEGIGEEGLSRKRLRLHGADILADRGTYENAQHEKIRRDAATRAESFQKGKTDEEIVKYVEQWAKQKDHSRKSKWGRSPACTQRMGS